MNTYTLYFNGSCLYCYRLNDSVSYWQGSVADAINSDLSYMQHADCVYDTENVIYRSEVPLTIDSNPEYFL